MVRLLKRTLQCVKEPSQPLGHIHRVFLRALQDVIIAFAIPLNLCRNAVKTLRTAVRSCNQHVANGPGNSSVAVLKGVQGDKPQMAQGCIDQAWRLRFRVHPFKKLPQFCLEL